VPEIVAPVTCECIEIVKDKLKMTPINAVKILLIFLAGEELQVKFLADYGKNSLSNCGTENLTML
jgi:hypothetical protein